MSTILHRGRCWGHQADVGREHRGALAPPALRPLDWTLSVSLGHLNVLSLLPMGCSVDALLSLSPMAQSPHSSQSSLQRLTVLSRVRGTTGQGDALRDAASTSTGTSSSIPQLLRAAGAAAASIGTDYKQRLPRVNTAAGSAARPRLQERLRFNTGSTGAGCALGFSLRLRTSPAPGRHRAGGRCTSRVHMRGGHARRAALTDRGASCWHHGPLCHAQTLLRVPRCMLQGEPSAQPLLLASRCVPNCCFEHPSACHRDCPVTNHCSGYLSACRRVNTMPNHCSGILVRAMGRPLCSTTALGIPVYAAWKGQCPTTAPSILTHAVGSPLCPPAALSISVHAIVQPLLWASR